MGDDKGGLALSQALDRLCNLLFRLGIQAYGGLIQQDDRSIAQKSSSNGQPPFLPSGKSGAAFTQCGFVTFREHPDEVVGFRGFCRFFYFLPCGSRLPDGNVLCDAHIENV